MGKSKGGKGGGKQAAAAAVAKCVCDHPFLCNCGNRPERPSRGHRWDLETQQWGGKGHKQKGGSGQVSLKAVEATTTSVGKTTIAQWQRMPTQLLDEVTKKEGRPRAKYKSIGNYKFRVIVQDAKVVKRGTDHDLILVPAHACDNEEQAREEAALLALLHLTPSIPHERKLPEPYKTTWAHAVMAAKEAKWNAPRGKPTETNNRKPPSAGASNHGNAAGPSSSRSGGGGAKASTNLSMGNSFVSHADRRRQQDKKRQERNARITKHEAVRTANRDHQVFLSAQMRKRIETLLRGEAVQWDDGEKDEENAEEELEDDLKAYVVERLQSEGFTKSQSKTSFTQIKIDVTTISEEEWDSIYDECLQWLCIHLDEDQLPEGFDPRGRTLDVIVADSSKSGKQQDAASPDEREIARNYGVQLAEATALLKTVKDTAYSIEQVAWQALFSKAATALTSSAGDECDAELNNEIAQDELEALEAIFPPEECQINRNGGTTSVVISVPSDDSKQKLQMELVTRTGVYPAVHVDRVLVFGSWSQPIGVAVHVKLIQFMSELPVSEPMMYEIFGKVQSLLQEAADGELSIMSLALPSSGNGAAKVKPQAKPVADKTPQSVQRAPKMRRRRERSPFWSQSPRQTPKAIAFPKLDANIRRQRESLPAAKARGDFLKAMQLSEKTGRVVLVTGDTGCGKTTQIPQFILEEAPDGAKIIVAQPRRLAATGVAARVANERGESQPGTGSVGYVVRGDAAMCKNTRLVFCTTGVLLRQLQSEGALDSITHIIVDEVHERHLDTDVLLGILKECIASTPHLRVILMSATLDADRFAGYWGPKTPRMHIPGRTFPVTDYMLEDVLQLTGYIPPKKGKKKPRFGGQGYQQGPRKSNPWADSERSDYENNDDETVDTESTDTTGGTNPQSHNYSIDYLVKRVDESTVDYDMLGLLVKALIQTKRDKGSILIFLSGVPEINNAINAISKIARGLSVDLLPLHGGLQPKDQNVVFKPARPGMTKVVLSTNVAETSITIPDCTFVIDTCREKQSSYDPVNRMPLLLEHFAAKASLKQRRGRAGRVQTGTCYKLISRATYEKLPEHGTPEIHRCALDQTLLSLMFLGVEKGSGNFLRTLLDAPSQGSLDSAIMTLQKLGAVSARHADGNFALTPLGMHLAGIPAPPPVGKILVMGSILGCRTAALAMAAGMSTGRSPFLRVDSYPRRGGGGDDESMQDMKRRQTLESRDELFKTVGNSDHAMLAAAYMQWDSLQGGERRQYCERLGLSFNGMRDMKQLARQLHSSLAAAGYDATGESDRNGNSFRIIRACAVAALAPSQIVRVHRASTKYAETMGGAKEKDGEAKALKFFIQAADDDSKVRNDQDESGFGSVNRRYHGVAEERVFMHPSSANFSTGNFSCPWLVYHELVRTSKPFLRDATECSAYALLLFGGKLEVQASNGLIVVAGWARLAANARIGALIGGLRKTMDELLARKIEEPGFDITSTTEMKLVRSLLVTDGMGQ